MPRSIVSMHAEPKAVQQAPKPHIAMHRGRTYIDDYVVMVSARPDGKNRVGGDMVAVTPDEYRRVVERDPAFLQSLSDEIREYQARKAAG
jgi:hypothetical protein